MGISRRAWLVTLGWALLAYLIGHRSALAVPLRKCSLASEDKPLIEWVKPLTLYDLDIMARTIWGEARGESHEHRFWIGCVIYNRFLDKDKRYGETISNVCQKPYQFSTWNEETATLLRTITNLSMERSGIFRDCMIAALEALNRTSDPTNGATHYFNHQAHNQFMPQWAMGHHPVAVYDPHWFFSGIDH